MPIVVVIAGPNGAGKSTSAPALLRDALGITTFVNADEIARGLCGFAPEQVAVKAGRIMLDRVHALGEEGANFAFETTLAGRSYARLLSELRGNRDYVVHLTFFWLPAVELCINRVRERVRRGGHNIPEETIRRRYAAGIRNFFELYRPLADVWAFYNNSGPGRPALVASGTRAEESVVRPEAWSAAKGGIDGSRKTS